ncbi:hypothetical protein L1987_81878 [Smallanthus sonchifolius]|uniref:Uncharacterized protein n=1 Tax=Smallanthus sonchifolius TaxID=185202 RepID=A0ACB8YQX9_9ASTR|nr:hypothetical protein L1987_81878 [Smallanthus sonchifolius]
MPECRLEGDHGEINYTVESKQENDTVEVEVEVNGMMNQHRESPLFNIPFHVLEMIMEFCVDIEYVNFRATCKQLTAPVTRWSNGASISRLQRYSLVSPWLMVLNKDRGIITFTDPMFGDQYSVRAPPELKGDLRIWCSMYGWLLISKDTGSMMLFNPFTSNIRKLPNLKDIFLESFCFSAPPSSPDCMVVGFCGPMICIHFVAREPASWFKIGLNFGGVTLSFFQFPTSCGRDLYALNSEGQLSVFTDICEDDDFSWVDVNIAPTSCCKSFTRYFLVKRDQDILLVIFGGSVDLFELDKWEKIDGLGKYMIYICDTTCLCIEARTPEMENKIYFAALHSENGKIVFYSLDTCRRMPFNFPCDERVASSINREAIKSRSGNRRGSVDQRWKGRVNSHCAVRNTLAPTQPNPTQTKPVQPAGSGTVSQQQGWTGRGRYQNHVNQGTRYGRID